MKMQLIFLSTLYLHSFSAFGQCDADYTVILNNYEFVPSELVISLSDFNPVGQSTFTDFVYAATASYYVGETLDANENVTTPAAWGPAEALNIGDTVFYMTSENYNLFNDGSIDSTWPNELEIINNYDANGVLLAEPDTLQVWNNVANIQDAEGNWVPTTFDYDSFYVELNGAVDSTQIQSDSTYTIAFINIEGSHNLNGINNTITGDYFNNPVDYYLENTIGTPEGVCMGVIEFDSLGVYNFDSSMNEDAQNGMSLRIYMGVPIEEEEEEEEEEWGDDIDALIEQLEIDCASQVDLGWSCGMLEMIYSCMNGSEDTCLYLEEIFEDFDFEEGEEEGEGQDSLTLSEEQIWFNDFSDPTTWIIDHDASACNLDWEIDTNLYCEGSFPLATIESTSYQNGCAMIDSDEYGGEEGGTEIEDSWITTANPINLSEYNNVVLQFETWYKSYNYEKCFIVLSTNNTDWPELTPDFDASSNPNVYEVFPDISGEANDQLFLNPTKLKFNISQSVGGESQVWLRFHWTGTYGYAWFLDDISLIEQPENDITLISEWARTSDEYVYGRTPFSQLSDSLNLGAEFFNFGSTAQTNINLTMLINDTSDNTMISVNEELATLDTALLSSLESTVPVDFTEGIYTLITEVSSDGDQLGGANFSDNTSSRNFQITENLYSLDGIGVYDEVDTYNNIGTGSSPNGDGNIIFARYTIIEETPVSGLEIVLSSQSSVGAEIYSFLLPESSLLNGDGSLNQPPDYSNKIAENQDGVVVTEWNIDNNMIYAPLEGTILYPGTYYACIELYRSDNGGDVNVLDDQTLSQPWNASLLYVQEENQVYTNGTAIGIRLAIGDYELPEDYIIEIPGIEGCTDETAINYTPDANTDDGSCQYEVVLGCTDDEAVNFNEAATDDDGSCCIEIFDNFDHYTSGGMLAIQSEELWSTWTNQPGGPEDAFISSDVSFSGLNSLKLESGGVTDIFLPLGNQTSGNWNMSFMMFIPSGNGAYFNMMHNVNGNNSNWAFEAYFSENGDGYIDLSTNTQPFTFDHDKWFLVSFNISISNGTINATIDGGENLSWDWTIGSNGVSSTIGAINLYPAAPSLYYVDNIQFRNDVCNYLGCTSDWADNFNQNATVDDGSCELVACNYPQFLEYNSNYTISDASLCLTLIVEGCIDDSALNYNPEANLNDGSCEFPVFGCTNSIAVNYDSTSEVDDGSCIIYGCTVSVFPNYNPEATVDDSSCSFDSSEIYGCTDVTYLEYDSLANTDNGSCYTLVIYGCTDALASNWSEEANIDDGSCIPYTFGCLDTLSCNYNALANIDNSSCSYPIEDYLDCEGNCLNDFDNDGICNELEILGCTDSLAFNYNSNAIDNDGSCIYIIYGCTNINACNYESDATNDDGSCVFPEIYFNCFGECLNDIDSDGVCDELETQGCTDMNASNYDPTASENDGSCIYPIYGCTNILACNFDSLATNNDGTCIYADIFYDCESECLNDIDGDAICDEFEISGCTDSIASNFNPVATDDNGNCIYIIYGCTNENACNYNIDATNEDGSCIFSEIYYDCLGNCINDQDLDQICDEIDNCKEDYNPGQEDTDNDGVGDACDYHDGIGIDEISEDNSTLIKMIDLLGREQQEHKKGSLLFYIYDNGKVEKRIIH